MSMVIKPKNWNEFQHYKDRNPPWIKLHKSLLDNYEFHALQLASKALAPCYWLLASEHPEGLITVDEKKLAWRFRSDELTIRATIKELILNGFFEVVQDASNALADRYQDAMPETETETETEKDLSSADADDNEPPSPPNVTPIRPKASAIPYNQIFDLYNEVVALPFNRPLVRVRNDKRKRLIKKIWDLGTETKNLEWWGKYFKLATHNEAWMNGRQYKDGFWEGANFDFLLREDNFLKVVE